MLNSKAIQFLFFSVFACGQDRPDFSAMSSAYERGDYQTVLNLLVPLAEKGVPEAEVRLGYLYCEGKAVPRDERRAISLLRSAASTGFAIGQYTLGGFYDHGFCVPQDSDEAARLFASAAQQGHGAAEYYVALRYMNAHSRSQDSSEADRWLRRAAEHGDVKATVMLSVALFSGLQDYAEAAKLCLKVSDRDDTKTCDGMLGSMYLHGSGTTKNYELAVKYLSLAAGSGNAANAAAQFDLSSMYMSGLGVLHDPRRGVELLTSSAEWGYPRAQRTLGVVYGTGIGVKRNQVLAYMWLLLAAKNGDSEASKVLGATRALLGRKEILKAEQLAREWAPRSTPKPAERTLAEFSPF